MFYCFGVLSDGEIIAYEWRLNGEVVATTASFEYTPTLAGTLNFTLTVTDDDGASSSDGVILTITEQINQNLIVNGGFEDIGDTVIESGDWKPFQVLNGWTLDIGSYMEIHAINHMVSSSEGKYYLDMDENPGNIQISQTMNNLVEGKQYKLSLYYANKAVYGNLATESGGVKVIWNGKELMHIVENHTSYKQYSMIVTAEKINKLTLLGTGSEDNQGAAIDNIELFSIN